MTEMIERVAKAICEAQSLGRESDRHIARVAIEAMRKPTAAMLDACYENDLVMHPHRAWAPMIDAALNTPDKPPA